jgi:hypothetical protein
LGASAISEGGGNIRKSRRTLAGKHAAKTFDFMGTVAQAPCRSQSDITPSWLNLEVSIVAHAKAVKPTNIRVADFLADIRDGKFRTQIEHIRAATGDERKTLKKKLPAVMWSGTFTRRANSAIAAHSGLLCADLDNVPANRLPEIRAKLCTSPYALAIFLSPSGTGLKALFKVPANPEAHKASFQVVQRHVGEVTGLPIDRACSDLARLCFVSFDPDLWIRPDQPAELPVCTHRPHTPHRTHTPHSTHNSHTVGVLEVVSVRDTSEAVEIALPRQRNANHRCLCKLAGALLAVAHNRGKSVDDSEVREAFNQWHTRSLPFLNPKQSKDQYLLEFLDAWANIKNPLRKSAADVAWDRAGKAAIPPEAVAKGFSDRKVCRMIAWCRELQLLHGDEPFFLSPYTVQKFFNQANHSTAAYWLGGLCKIGILTKIQAGSPRVWAASYRFNFANKV